MANQANYAKIGFAVAAGAGDGVGTLSGTELHPERRQNPSSNRRTSAAARRSRVPPRTVLRSMILPLSVSVIILILSPNKTL